MLTVYFDNGQKAEVRTAIKIEKVKEARYLQLPEGGSVIAAFSKGDNRVGEFLLSKIIGWSLEAEPEERW